MYTVVPIPWPERGCTDQWAKPDGTIELDWQFAPSLRTGEQFRITLARSEFGGTSFAPLESLFTYDKKYDLKLSVEGQYRWTVTVVRANDDGTWLEVSKGSPACAFGWQKAAEKPDDEPSGVVEPPEPPKDP